MNFCSMHILRFESVTFSSLAGTCTNKYLQNGTQHRALAALWQKNLNGMSTHESTRFPKWFNRQPFTGSIGDESRIL